jgi:hypothetical protein
MQIPIPHIGARGSPQIEIRQAAPLKKMAAAMLVPAGTRTILPFTVRRIFEDVSLAFDNFTSDYPAFA